MFNVLSNVSFIALLLHLILFIVFFFCSRFKLNMNRLQNLIMDQPISNSVDRATWWIEYVIRNKGTVSIFLLIIRFLVIKT